LESRTVTHIPGAIGGWLTESFLLVADLLPLVMAIWSQWAIWDIHGRLRTEPGEATTQDRRNWSKRRGRRHVCTYTRGGTAADPGGGRDNVPFLSKDGDPVGEGRE